ncbi:MAG TPA: hypothetical protein EYG73_13900 [Arcobacter sp.]|nr:hypothetical protein [Arcobacter sp.]
MNFEEFNNYYDKLSILFNQQKVLTINMIFPLVNCIFQNTDMLLLSYKKPSDDLYRIIPTLSVIKLTTSQAEELEYISNIEKKLSILVDNQSLLEIKKEAEEKNFIIKDFPANDCLILIKKNTRPLNKNILEKLASTIFFIKKQSLNLLNDSLKKRNSILEEVEKFYKPETKDFFIELCSFLCKKFPNINFYPVEYVGKSAETWIDMLYSPINPWKDNHDNIVENKSITEHLCVKYDPQKRDSQKRDNDIRNENIPFIETINSTQYIIYPFKSSLKLTYLRYIVVLQGEISESLESYLIENLRYITNHYYAIYLKQEKYNILYKLTNRTFNLSKIILNNIEFENSFDIHKLIYDALSDLFPAIIELSSLHSINFRLVDYKNKELVSIINAEDDNNVKHIKNIIDEPKTKDPIKLNNIYSQDVLVFKNQEKIYTPNVNKTSAYQENRENTKSALTFPIQYKKNTIGIINFESPLEDGLKEYNTKDTFFDDFVLGIENYIKTAFDLNDTHWIARRSQMYQNNHEIRTIIENDKIPKDIQKAIQQHINVVPIKVANKLRHISELKKYRNECINVYFEGSDEIFGKNHQYIKDIHSQYEYGIKVNIDSDLYIVEYKLDMIKIIYKNILDNFHRHSLHKKDTILLCNVKEKNGKQKNKTDYLFIKAKLFNIYKFKNKDINSLLYSPYNEVSSNGEIKTHYGLFMVGMLSRYLNGHASIYYNIQKRYSGSEERFVQLNVKIPIDRII